MGLQLADVENDPLVKETLQILRDAIVEKYKGNEYGPQARHLEMQLDNPLFKLLADTDCLDPVSAAVLATDHLRSLIEIDDVEPKLNPDVAEVMKVMAGDRDEGPEALLKSKNPLVFKLLVAAITQGISG